MNRPVLSLLALLTIALAFTGLACDGEKEPYNPDTTTTPDSAAPADQSAPDLLPLDAPAPADTPAPQDIVDPTDLPQQDIPTLDVPVEDIPLPDTPVEDIPLPDVPVEETVEADIVTEELVEDVVELPPGCCYNDDDCDLGTDAVYVCGWNDMSGEWGRCMWLPQEGGCWDDSDCPEGKVCQGAFYCPCDALCGAPDVPGTCMDPDQAGDIGDPCGQDGGPCKEGLVCCYPCGIPGCIFECSEPCDADEPWCEGGCPLYA